MQIYILKIFALFSAAVNVHVYQKSCFWALVLMFFAWKHLAARLTLKNLQRDSKVFLVERLLESMVL